MNLFFKKQKRKIGQKGFSLVELLVVVAIFVTITTVILIRQNRFSSDISVTNSAYQVGLAIRQAQVYGLSVRSTEANCATCFDSGYGIHLDSANRNSYLFFGDKNGNFMFDDSTEDLSIQNKVITQDVNIKTACIIASKETRCLSSSGGKASGEGLKYIDLVFKRPNPEALISGRTEDGTSYTDASRVYIAIQTAAGNRVKCLNVYQTGQISVAEPDQSNNCQ